MRWYRKPEPDEPPANGKDIDTIILKLEIECTRNKKAARDEDDPLRLYHNAHVYARDLVWDPKGKQHQYFAGDGAVRAFNPDILLAKLRPGQVIDLEMHCIKGIGADHAKFSPVATASYRLLPKIDIVKPILGDDAKKFARCFPKGVIGLETVTDEDVAQNSEYQGHVGEKKAVVEYPLGDTVSRECLRHDEFVGKVKLGRVRDHFIFSVESTGQYDSDDLFLESIKVLKAKCTALKRDLGKVIRS